MKTVLKLYGSVITSPRYYTNLKKAYEAYLRLCDGLDLTPLAYPTFAAGIQKTKSYYHWFGRLPKQNHIVIEKIVVL